MVPDLLVVDLDQYNENLYQIINKPILKTENILDCKTVRIFAYSSARNTLTPRFTDFFTDFEKKTDCFAV